MKLTLTSRHFNQIKKAGLTKVQFFAIWQAILQLGSDLGTAYTKEIWNTVVTNLKKGNHTVVSIFKLFEKLSAQTVIVDPKHLLNQRFSTGSSEKEDSAYGSSLYATKGIMVSIGKFFAFNSREEIITDRIVNAICRGGFYDMELLLEDAIGINFSSEQVRNVLPEYMNSLKLFIRMEDLEKRVDALNKDGAYTLYDLLEVQSIPFELNIDSDQLITYFDGDTFKGVDIEVEDKWDRSFTRDLKSLSRVHEFVHPKYTEKKSEKKSDEKSEKKSDEPKSTKDNGTKDQKDESEKK